MQRDLQKLETVSQNVANTLTPGYKRQLLVSQPFGLQVQQGLLSTTASVASAATVYTDPTAAPFRFTGASHDVAIEGDGLFEISTPDGPRYTRIGNLRVDSQGRLVGAQDMPVMGQGGEIVLTNGNFDIAANGEVRQDGRVAGVLKVVRFDQAGSMQAVGNGLYAQGGAQPAEHVGAVRVRSGHIEQSNVNTAREMVALSETMRHFEAMQKLIQGYDDSLEKTIRKLGEF
jgi:flagellar basal-body rod protein FlgF